MDTEIENLVKTICELIDEIITVPNVPITLEQEQD